MTIAGAPAGPARYPAPSMCAPSASPAAITAAALALAGCAFSPDGGAGAGDDDDRDPIDAPDTAIDAASSADARTMDAAVDAGRDFDVSTCPDEYRGVLNTSSRYRVIDGGPFATVAAACRDHLPGATHLTVFSGIGERDALGAALFFGGEFRRTWIGVYDAGGGARTVTGEPVYPSIALAPMRGVTWIRDLITPFRADGLSSSFAAVCECDGRPSLF